MSLEVMDLCPAAAYVCVCVRSVLHILTRNREQARAVWYNVYMDSDGKRITSTPGQPRSSAREGETTASDLVVPVSQMRFGHSSRPWGYCDPRLIHSNPGVTESLDSGEQHE
jgi:hypothetical protein